jgi:hypothetical protein
VPTTLEHGRRWRETEGMELRNLVALQETWQRAVREHAAFVRDAKAQNLSPQETHRRGRIYVLRIDAAFAQLRSAERGANGLLSFSALKF